VEAYLARWISVRYLGTRLTELGCGGNRTAEPGWLVWAGTVAAKVARCPVDRWGEKHIGSSLPAVELVARAEWELRTVANELETEARMVARGSASRAIYRAKVADYERTVAMVQHVRQGKAWKAGMEYLSEELALCERDDPSFSRACREIGTRVVGE
jgi:hypothetical protein